MKNFRRKYTGEIFLVLSALSYCFEWYFIRELFSLKLTALDIVFTRSIFSVAIIAIVFPLINTNFYNFKHFKRQDIKYIFILGGTAITGSTFFNFAIETTTVANTLILFYTCIFWGALLGFLFLGERTTKISILYTFMAFAGISLALLKGSKHVALSFGAGEISALLGSVVFSLDAITSRKIKHTNAFQRLFLVNIIVVVIYFIFTLTTKDIAYFERFFSCEFLIYGLILAFTCGVIAKGFMFLGFNYTPVSIALVILLLEPIVQMTTAYLFANETISIINCAGIFIVFSMVVLISKQKSKIIKE